MFSLSLINFLIVLFVKGLSENDRAFFVNALFSGLKDDNSVFIVEQTCHARSSGHDCLVSIAENLLLQSICKQSVYKSKIGFAHKLSSISQQLREFPLKLIESLIHDSASSNNSKSSRTLIVVLRRCEMLDVKVFNSLILLLSQSSICDSVHIIAFVDALCSLPVQLSAAAQAALQVTIHSTASAWDIYDELMGRLFNTKEIPVVFTAQLIRSMHNSFKDSELCISTAIDR